MRVGLPSGPTSVSRLAGHGYNIPSLLTFVFSQENSCDVSRIRVIDYHELLLKISMLNSKNGVFQSPQLFPQCRSKAFQVPLLQRPSQDLLKFCDVNPWLFFMPFLGLQENTDSKMIQRNLVFILNISSKPALFF